MDVITIKDLAVMCRIGVPDEERANPQRLLVTIEMEGDFSGACQSDEISETVNYYDAARKVSDFCANESFKLIEKLAHELSRLVIKEFKPERVSIEVKKFILPDAEYVAFKLNRDF